MSISSEKLAELRAKRLEMLQGAVARMAGVGVTLKNYSSLSRPVSDTYFCAYGRAVFASRAALPRVIRSGAVEPEHGI